MRIAFVVYHDVLDDRVMAFLEELEIDNYIKWENVLSKSHGASPHLGTRTFPGHDFVRLIPFRDDDSLNNLVKKIQEFNAQVTKKDDEIRIYMMPLERIV